LGSQISENEQVAHSPIVSIEVDSILPSSVVLLLLIN